MTSTLVDTNVFLDLITNDREWGEWSSGQLAAAMRKGRLLINDVIYAEISIRFDTPEMLEAMLADFRALLDPIPRQALFDAGKAFRRYRASGGLRTGVLPDFFIGAHAAVANVPLLTRDPRRYRAYYATVELITP